MPVQSLNECRAFVKRAHALGLEVYLDVVYNHTAEGNHMGPTLSFRGIDNKVFYMLAPEGEYYNYSGCGNTVNCNHPVTRTFIRDSLRYFRIVKRTTQMTRPGIPWNAICAQRISISIDFDFCAPKRLRSVRPRLFLPSDPLTSPPHTPPCSRRWWVTHMHIDGFRFDLASILTRSPSQWHLPGICDPAAPAVESPDGSILPRANGEVPGTPLTDPPLIQVRRIVTKSMNRQTESRIRSIHHILLCRGQTCPDLPGPAQTYPDLRGPTRT